MLEVPVIQGGMGVGISLGNLAGAVMKEGGMGVISAAHPGYRKKDFWKNSLEANLKAIEQEAKKARCISQGHGLLGINIMCASRDYQAYVEKACELGYDCILSGAGLPLSLPAYVKDSIQIIPIISSGKALYVLSQRWIQRYRRYPDAIVIEGSLAGGHLGFKEKDLFNHTCQSLEEILTDVLEIIANWPKKVPVFVAGGLWSYKDLKHMQSLGATGIQLGTRFITTYECDAHINFKNAILSAKKEDLAIIKSPTGFPGRAIKNKWFNQNKDKKQCIQGCIHCLKMCTPSSTPYCISRALIAAVKGDIDHGLIFSGANVEKASYMEFVKDIMDEMKGLRQ